MKMNVVMVCALLVAASTFVSGQEPKEQAESISNAESFSAQAGTLIERQFFDVGKVKGVDVRVQKIKDLISGKTMPSLRFEYEEKKAYTSDTKISAIDLDEIDGLVKSLKALLQEMYYAKREVYTEITFKSRTGFVCGGYYDVAKSDWVGFIKVGRYGQATSFVSKEEMSKFLGLVEQAQGKM